MSPAPVTIPAPMAEGPVFTSQPVDAHYPFDPTEEGVLPDVASDFHEATKMQPALSAYVRGPAQHLWTAGYKTVPNEGLATRRWYTLAYPLPPALPIHSSLSDVVAARASTSPPGSNAITAAELATVLSLAYGATRVPGDPRVHRRPVPSGGGCYPLDLYVAVRPAGVSAGLGEGDVPAGLHHYDPFRHCLEQLSDEVGWQQVVAASPAAATVQASAVAVLLVGCFARQTAKYGPRGYRFTYLEAGHVGQNLSLVGEGLGLGVLPFASIYDRAVEDALGVDGVHESLVHTVLLGRP